MNRHHHSATTARFAVALVLSGPILWAAWASHQPIDRIFANGSPGSGTDAPSWQWSNYRDAVTRLPLLRFVANSVVITTAATLGTVLSTSLAGFAFARLRWRGRRLWHVVLLATMMLPGQVLLIGQFFVFSRLGWVNTYKPLIVPAWLAASSLAVLVFREFFRAVPRSYVDAARLDGATDWQVYWEIMLPMSRPVVAAVAAMTAVYHWQTFLPPLVYLSDYQGYPVSVGLRMYQAMEGSWANLIMAASLIAMLPPLVVVLVAHRVLVDHRPPS